MGIERPVDDRPDDAAGIHAFERGLDDQVRAMARESQLVEDDIQATRKHWEELREDRSQPGARPREDSPPREPLEEVAGDWSGTSEAAEEAGQG
ncbi:hypothetical protein Q5424_05180 [Conexibacter sp. JD483]|uniref:hypothetical protein n=1 Tax=unclassified Conexibacter TaxID=2627773 RepID=UPI002721FB3D|nr:MULTISPECIES: hypothetical protein [unclassified Conexibacter]MDO8186725.1 hypothetical protein [Conexibacter sp. CPCC 205706]MDO8199011.1 hypothetical protein [Conexibacter sp. CPCC 205762]MDR9368463.1 hypothetical protein [Conexibacter sp. JD483]